jgi:hypothetical protein
MDSITFRFVEIDTGYVQWRAAYEAAVKFSVLPRVVLLLS